jgi:hypothetical protein
MMKGARPAMKNKRIQWKKRKRNLRRRRQPSTPAIRFTPPAWAKLLFLRDYGETEIGGFGISCPEDLLLVEDVQLVRQTCSWGHVSFDDQSVADFFDRQVDTGRPVETFGRLWIHTHPGDCPLPSFTDEETFERVFGGAHWAIMFILARGGRTYARLRFNVGPGRDIEIPVEQDYSTCFAGCDPDAWEQEYLANVEPEILLHPAAARWLPFEGEPAQELLDFSLDSF